MGAAVQLERRVTGARILGVVVRKLGHLQEPSPVNLFVVDEGLGLCLHRVVLPFGLSVGLGIEGGGELTFDS